MIIENYRGYEIGFYTKIELFYCKAISEETAPKFNTIKKRIDELIAKNKNFKEFKCFKKAPTHMSEVDLEISTISNLRKDDRFNKYQDGKKVKISEHYEKDYFIAETEHFAILEEMQKQYEEYKKIHDEFIKKRVKLINSLNMKLLTEKKKEILGRE